MDWYWWVILGTLISLVWSIVTVAFDDYGVHVSRKEKRKRQLESRVAVDIAFWRNYDNKELSKLVLEYFYDEYAYLGFRSPDPKPTVTKDEALRTIYSRRHFNYGGYCYCSRCMWEREKVRKNIKVGYINLDDPPDLSWLKDKP